MADAKPIPTQNAPDPAAAANLVAQVQQPQAQAPAQAAKPTPVPDAQWKCEIKGLDDKGGAVDLPEKITIGDRLLMTCEGPLAKLDASAQLRIETSPDQPPAFYVQEIRELKETSATLVVSPWLGGTAKLKNPVLTDKKVRVGLGDLELQMTSVIDPAKNPEGKPYPPEHPLSLAWPLWFWLLAGALALGVAYLIGLLVRQSLRRKKLLTMLEKNAIALSPLNHLNKELRKLQRQIPVGDQKWDQMGARAYFKTLETEFRWFLARELIIPAIEGSSRTIQKTLKKNDPELFKSVSRELRIVLSETRKAQTSNAGSEDALQLMELVRTLASRIVKERTSA